ncbi:MAG: hypothetical protein E6Y39_12545, partial [Clostridium butyricum]|nr:hypothetical protein [Clostridium butyricum]
MKYTVEGFSQKSLIDYGLDEKDALILRYFIDFKDSGKMKMKIINKVPYYWLKGSALLEQLPILRINNVDVLRRRLKKMTSCKILMHEHVLEGGSYAFYAIGENYQDLLLYDDASECEDSGDTYGTTAGNNIEENEIVDIKLKKVSEINEGLTEKTGGITEKKESISQKSEDSDWKVGAKDYSINKSINNNHSACDITQAGIQSEKQKLQVNCKTGVPYDEVINMFNDLCRSFPKVKVRNKTRDNNIKKMYKNLHIDEIKAIFEMAEKSDYLSGRNGKWMNCSFDWIIKEN